MLLATETMVRLAIVARVGSEPFEPNMRACLTQSRLKIANIELGTLVGKIAEDEMIRTVDQQTELRKSRVFSGLPDIWLATSTMDEVTAAVTRLHTGRVNRGERNLAFPAHHAVNRVVQETRDRSAPKQAPSRFLKRGIVWHLGKFDGFAQRRAVRQMGDQPTIVGLKKRLQNQAGKELMLREFFWAVLVAEPRKNILRNGPGRRQHLPWRFARPAHAYTYEHHDNLVRSFPTERNRLFFGFFQIFSDSDKNSVAF